MQCFYTSFKLIHVFIALRMVWQRMNEPLYLQAWEVTPTYYCHFPTPTPLLSLEIMNLEYMEFGTPTSHGPVLPCARLTPNPKNSGNNWLKLIFYGC